MEKFYRDSNDKRIAGVCSGIANFFNIPNSTWLIRLLFILFINNFSIVLYFVIWFIADEK